MSEVFRLQGTIDVNTQQATTSLKQVSNQGQQAESKFASIGGGLQKVGATMSAVGAGITAGVGKIIGTSKEWGAEVAQQEFLYKNLDGSIQKFISTGAKQAQLLGMTEQQYENNATALSNTLNLLGMSDKTISSNGEKWMNLCADMGAFADVPIDVALGDMKSALVGNFEALDKYGMNLSVATIDQGEYAKSLGKTWKTMSNAEKAQAIMSEAMKQAGNYTGLAKQEANDFGMKWNLCKQKMMEGAAAIGEKLLPVLAPLVEKIGNAAQKVADWANEHPKLTQTILLVVGAIGVLMVTAGPLLIFIGTLMTVIPAIMALGAPVIGIIAGVTLGITALIAIGVALVANWDIIKAKASEIWSNIKTTIGNAVNAVKTKVVSIWNSIKNTTVSVFNGVKSVASSVWNGIKTVITNVVNTIKSKVTSIWNAIKSVTSSVFNGIKSITSSVWNGVKSTVSNIVNGIKSSVSNAFNAVKSTATRVWNGVKSAITNPINAAKSAVSRAMSAIKSAVNVLLKPKLKLPHIKVSGKFSINPPSVPKIGVDWYAKGGIMTSPTMFGMNGNRAMFGGEAGDEAILPLDGFYKHLDKKLEGMNGSNYYNVNFNFSDVKIQNEQDMRKMAEIVNVELQKIINRNRNKTGGALVV